MSVSAIDAIQPSAGLPASAYLMASLLVTGQSVDTNTGGGTITITTSYADGSTATTTQPSSPSSVVASEITSPNADGTITVTTTYADGRTTTTTLPNPNPPAGPNGLYPNNVGQQHLVRWA